jgi:hypothetical protein
MTGATVQGGGQAAVLVAHPSSLCRSADARFVAGCAHGQVWAAAGGTRVKLGEVRDSRDLRLQVCLGRLVLVALKRHPLVVFDAGAALPLLGGSPSRDAEVELCGNGNNSKSGGLGALLELDGSRVLLACGRGIGKGHVFLLVVGTGAVTLEHLCSVSPSGNTIVAMQWSAEGALVTVTSEKVAQLWSLATHREGWPRVVSGGAAFQLTAGQAARVPFEPAALAAAAFGGDEGAALRLVADFERLSALEPAPAEWLRGSGEAGTPWAQLFPPRLLDPLAYDGDVDGAGRPHGTGEMQLEGEPGCVYLGTWRKGQRHGLGEVRNARSQLVYSGGWRHGLRHGFGTECKPNGEQYEGWFVSGRRHGLGFLQSVPVAAEEGRRRTNRGQAAPFTQLVGFHRAGKRHGLFWCTYPRGSPDIPFAITAESMAHLGAIRSVIYYKDGKFHGEQGFHRADGQPLSGADRLLFNFSAHRRHELFSAQPDGRAELDVCWACLEELESQAQLQQQHQQQQQQQQQGHHPQEHPRDGIVLECGNRACGMKVHRACLGGAAKFCLLDNSRRLFCEDIEPDEWVELARMPPRWFCYMPACQALARAALDESQHSLVSELEEVPAKPAPAPPPAYERRRQRRRKPAAGKAPRRATAAASLSSGPALDHDLQPLNLPFTLTSVKSTLPAGSSLHAVAWDGLHVRVETDSDLEEAVEEALLRCEKLQLYWRAPRELAPPARAGLLLGPEYGLP